MGEAVLIVLYIFFCLLTGLCGSQRRMGFFGTFIVSLFITPVLMLLVLVFTAPRDEQRRRPQGN
jgi:peptidoglycan/LPS O-acetylase OafA/YrhL